MKTYNKVIAMVVAGVACSAITSSAALVAISQGGTVDITGDSAAVTGTLINTLVSPYSNSSDTGTFTTQVYEGNSNGASDLTFVYTMSVTAGDIGSITVNGFTGTVNIGNLAGSTPAAGTTTYSPDFLKFNWNPNTQGPVSVVVETSSTTYAGDLGSVQDGQTSNVAIYAPVPEPTTIAAGALMLLPFGIGALRSLRKDRVS